MSGRLAGRSAFITGAAGGIGAATARLFLAEGASVALADRDPDALAAIEHALLQEPPTVDRRAVMTVVVDVTDEGSVAAALDTAIAALGRLDILVNNAAARNYARLDAADARSWEAVLGVNLVGAQTCARLALPHLRASGAGAIVNVSSAFALIGRRGMGQYDASKAGLVALTRVLAAEEAANGVRVNAVCPGSVLTGYTRGRAAARGMSDADLVERGAFPSLMRRWGLPEEIAAPILWLASPEASFITGAVLAVDGGLSASTP